MAKMSKFTFSTASMDIASAALLRAMHLGTRLSKFDILLVRPPRAGADDEDMEPQMSFNFTNAIVSDFSVTPSLQHATTWIWTVSATDSLRFQQRKVNPDGSLAKQVVAFCFDYVMQKVC